MADVDPNSMFVWMPAVELAGVPHPKTRLWRVPHEKLSEWANGAPLPVEIIEDVKRVAFELAQEVGWPLFLRTDLASGKHDWERTCYVPNEVALGQCLWGVVEANEIADIFGLPYEGLALREFLPLESTFKAFRRMPVAVERRYFTTAGKGVECHHPYWPDGAIEQGWHEESLPEDWRERLAALNDESKDPPYPAHWAAAVVDLLGGSWSVDFAKTTEGKWFLIDMAHANQSWHPDHPGGGDAE